MPPPEPPGIEPDPVPTAYYADADLPTVATAYDRQCDRVAAAERDLYRLRTRKRALGDLLRVLLAREPAGFAVDVGGGGGRLRLHSDGKGIERVRPGGGP